MLTPEKPGRTKGAEQRLWSLTYSQIAEWSGLSVRTVREYASRGQFDSKDLHSTLRWVNERRDRLGLPLIGQLGEPDQPDRSENAASEPPQPPIPSNYDPTIGDFRDG